MFSYLSLSKPPNPKELLLVNIKLDFPVNLDVPEIYQFAASASTTWKAPLPSRPEFTADPQRSKTMGIVDRIPSDTQPVQYQDFRLCWSQEQEWSVWRGQGHGQFVASFKETQCWYVNATLELDVVLFLNDTLPAPQRTKLQAAFDQFDPIKTPDIVAYFSRLLASDTSLSPDSFWIVNSFQLKKTGAPQQFKPTRWDQARSLIAGKLPQCTVYPTATSSQTCETYFRDNSTRIVPDGDPIVVPKYPDCSLNTGDAIKIKPGDSPVPLIVNSAAETVRHSGCEVHAPRVWRVLTLSQLHNERFAWRTKSWHFWTFFIIVPYLAHELQLWDFDLWAYLGYPSTADQADVDIYVQIATGIALSGAVTSLALADLAAARNAFSSALEVEIEFRYGHPIDCLVPLLNCVLALHDDWHEVFP